MAITIINNIVETIKVNSIQYGWRLEEIVIFLEKEIYDEEEIYLHHQQVVIKLHHLTHLPHPIHPQTIPLFLIVSRFLLIHNLRTYSLMLPSKFRIHTVLHQFVCLNFDGEALTIIHFWLIRVFQICYGCLTG